MCLILFPTILLVQSDSDLLEDLCLVGQVKVGIRVAQGWGRGFHRVCACLLRFHCLQVLHGPALGGKTTICGTLRGPTRWGAAIT